MKKTSLLSFFVLTFFVASSLSCSSVGPRKYLFFGDPQAERVEMFEDYWSDFPFKPDDPNLPLRRGKGGVVRFFKKDAYSRSIMVDGDLTVNVYYSADDGVSLREPDSQLVLTSEELNEKHRKFDKEVGYSYHVYLDLGVYDQPEEEITILSVFKDAKTGQTTLSKEIHTTAMGTTPLKKVDQDDEDEIERLMRKRLEKIRKGRYVANDEEDFEEALEEENEEYLEDEEATPRRSKSARRQASNGVKKTRVRDSIDLENTQFEDLDFEDNHIDAVSYTESALSKRNAALLDALERNQEKLDYYNDKDRREFDRIKREYEDYENGEEISPVKRVGKSTRSSKSKARSSSRYVDMQSDLTDRFEELSNQLSSGFEEKYEQEAKKRNRTLRKTPAKTVGYANEEEYEEDLDDEYEEESSVGRDVKSTKRTSLVEDEYGEEDEYEEEEPEYKVKTPNAKKQSASNVKRATTDDFYEIKPSSVSYETPKQSSKRSVDSSPYVYNEEEEEEYEPVSVWSTRLGEVKRETEMDRLDDFQPEDKSIQTEVIVKKKTARK